YPQAFQAGLGDISNFPNVMKGPSPDIMEVAEDILRSKREGKDD
ncbi:hypothetical protein LCGC14_2457480, partial [marine sediment metagenome]